MQCSGHRSLGCFRMIHFVATGADYQGTTVSLGGMSTMNGAPSVSCMCLTYGRPPHLVEEAIESFLRQDYRGQKELIVLNDLFGQELRFEHPEVQIVNVGKRF